MNPDDHIVNHITNSIGRIPSKTFSDDPLEVVKDTYHAFDTKTKYMKAKTPQEVIACTECQRDTLNCSCQECDCTHCVELDCSCRPQEEEDHEPEPDRPVQTFKDRTHRDDEIEELVAKANTPSLGALFKDAMESGLISQATGYQ